MSHFYRRKQHIFPRIYCGGGNAFFFGLLSTFACNVLRMVAYIFLGSCGAKRRLGSLTHAAFGIGEGRYGLGAHRAGRRRHFALLPQVTTRILRRCPLAPQHFTHPAAVLGPLRTRAMTHLVFPALVAVDWAVLPLSVWAGIRMLLHASTIAPIPKKQ